MSVVPAHPGSSSNPTTTAALGVLVGLLLGILLGALVATAAAVPDISLPSSGSPAGAAPQPPVATSVQPAPVDPRPNGVVPPNLLRRAPEWEWRA